MTEVKAHLRYLRIAPRKVRLIADMMRGKNVVDVERQLHFSSKRSARPLAKLVASARANARNNFKLDDSKLFIKEIRVDEGPTLKRWMPRARGVANIIRKRTSHITLVLGEREPVTSNKLKAKS